MTRPLMLLFVAIVAVLSSVPGLAVVDAVDVLRALSADHFAVVISRPEDVGIVPRNDPDATLLDLPVAGESRLHLTFHLERVESSRSSTNHPSTQFRSSPMRRLLFGKKLDIVIEQVDALSKKQHRWFVARDIYVNDLVKSTDQDANAFQSFTLKWDLPVELVPPIQVDTTLSDLQREVHYGHLDARHFVIKFFVSGKLSRGKELMPVNNGDAYLEFSVARAKLIGNDPAIEESKLFQLLNSDLADRRSFRSHDNEDGSSVNAIKSHFPRIMETLLGVNYNDGDVMLRRVRLWYAALDRAYLREGQSFHEMLMDFFAYKRAFPKYDELKKEVRRLDQELFDFLLIEPGWIARRRMRNLMKNWNAYIANKQTTELPPFPAHAFGSHYLKRTTYVEIITRMLDTHKCRMARDDMPALGLADTTIAASTPLLQRRSLEGGEQSQWTSRMVQVFANAHSAAQSELCVAHPSAGAVPARTNRQHLVKRFSGPLGQVLLLVKLVLLMGIVWRVFLRPYDFFFKEPCYFFYRHHVPATRPEMLQLTPTF